MSEHNFKPKTTIGNTGNVKNTQEVKNLSEKAKKLTKFCSENGNPINIVDSGENFVLKNINIEQVDFDNLNELVDLTLDTAKAYLNGPIFTDRFGKDHSMDTGRRGWEKKWEKERNEKELSNEEKEISEYYLSNRLGINRFNNVIDLLGILLESSTSPEMKNKLIHIKDEISTDAEGLVNHKDGHLIYSTLDDSGKVEQVKNFSKIVQELISVLE